MIVVFFFFSSRRRHTRYWRDWSSDVCSSDLYCVGAGLSLACACDTIVAAEDSRLGAGFGRIGLMADLGLPHTLPLRVGQGRARQIFLYHEQMTAAAAERIGLVDHVVPKGHALDKALEKARFLAEQAPAPMALTKQMPGEGLDRALEQERHFQSTLFITEDFAEAAPPSSASANLSSREAEAMDAIAV